MNHQNQKFEPLKIRIIKTERKQKNMKQDKRQDYIPDIRQRDQENKTKKLLLELMYDKNYRPMKLKELCVLLEVPR